MTEIRAIADLLASADAVLMLDKFAGPPSPTRWQRWMVRWLPRWAIPRDAAETVARRMNWCRLPKHKGEVIRWCRLAKPAGEPQS